MLLQGNSSSVDCCQMEILTCEEEHCTALLSLSYDVVQTWAF